MWKLALVVSKAFVPTIEDELLGLEAGGLSPTVSSFEVDEDGNEWTVEVFFEAEPDKAEIEGLIRLTAEAFGEPVPAFELGLMEQKDWVRESQLLLQPVVAGRFYVYGSHDADTLPADKIGIHMDAGQAFGSGSHETTSGCLMLLDELGHKISPATVLDLGCGSGILGIAAAKIWDCLIIGSDIDPIATDTAIENATLNGVKLVSPQLGQHGFAGVTCAGFEDPALSNLAPYDLIIANILMEPLLDLAEAIARNVKDGGLVILSGLLDSQEARITATYSAAGLKLQKRVPLKHWHTLLFLK